MFALSSSSSSSSSSRFPRPSRRVFSRRTRHGLELRIDGTVASLVRPDGAATGPVWDALAAPLLVLKPTRRRRLLVLGLAGGSVARVARALLPGATIVGVEKDRDVLDVALREFGLESLGVEIVEDDAFRYLRRERRRFDAVIEDLMVGTTRTVRKPVGLFERYDLVTQRVARGGVLIVNTIHETPRMTRILARGPGTLLRIGVEGYYNHILAVGPPALRAGALRARLAAHPVLSASLAALTLRTLRP